jgi:Acetyltransferase (GNAT) family
MSFACRHYVESDRDGCLAVFDSNVPEYFGAHERPCFERYLTNLPGPCVVLVDGAEIVACGGLAPHKTEPATTELAWGMVLRSRHKMGLGALLLLERIAIAERNLSKTSIFVQTSQFSAGFYTRMGFRTLRAIPDGYFPGMDKRELMAELPYRRECAALRNER